MTVNSNSKKKYKYAKKWESIILRFEQKKVSVRVFCKKEKIGITTLYRNLKKYKTHGFDGLIDKRQGVSHKAKGQIEKYIIETRIKDKDKSAADMSIEIKKRFGIDLSRSQICRKMKAIDLNAPAGRKKGKKTLKKTFAD